MSSVLVLDVGGVILADPLAMVFDRLSEHSSVPRDRITNFYSKELRAGLWTGTLDEEDFWKRLLDFCSLGSSVDIWRGILLKAIEPLPAASRLQPWSDAASLWLLSNHRMEWLIPRLHDLGYLERFQRLFVSSELGRMKPDPELYRRVCEELDSTCRVLLVDDKASHAEAAERAGIPAMVADANCTWMERVDAWLWSHA